MTDYPTLSDAKARGYISDDPRSIREGSIQETRRGMSVLSKAMSSFNDKYYTNFQDHK